ncbi:MAG: primosomal protein N' [Finegoldia magna]|nr:primosomal protein N' [Finegoldia magna]MDU5069499.1 primosomal protein N' [Finegoldia magna]
MYIDVIFRNKSKMTNRLYSYYSSEDVEIGMRVIVPFGKSNINKLALVVRINDNPKKDIDYKEIISVVDLNPIVTQESIDMAFFMVDKYLSDYSSAFQTILPPGNFEELKEYFTANDKLLNVDEDLYNILKTKKEYSEIKEISDVSHKRLMEYVKSDFLKMDLVYDQQITPKLLKYVKLIEDNPVISKRANAQQKIVDMLKTNNNILYSELLAKTNTTSSVVKALEEKKIVEIYFKEVDRVVVDDTKTYQKIKLNSQQEKAYNSILENQFNLLHGVTGSGKTEVYLHLVEKMLNEGKDSIVLVPEISLTPQTIERFEGRFPGKVAIIHSKLNVNEKFEQFRKMYNGEYKIVVGARSAVFSPFKNLGLIIIDEEHETSYVSEKNPKYNAIDISGFRAEYNNAKLLLGSATPGVEEYSKALKGEYNLIEMNKRANDTNPVECTIVDMRKELETGNMRMFSKVLLNKIQENLNNKKQTILFLNKRGHTSFISCRRCGYVLKCDSCDVSMTYHKTKNRLICHMCGRTALKPKVCPNCGSKFIKEFGAGTQKLEEETRELFPNARIARMDRDTTNTKKDYKKIYDMMNNQEIDILIGTQMLSKGFDFPNVTLVGVMAADISLNLGDYKSNEKTFQLITQVAGRAGRAEYEGDVIIQTYKPDNFAITSAALHDYKMFYEKEIKLRKSFNYPPFFRILNINISSKNRNVAMKKINEVSNYVAALIRRYKLSTTLINGPHPSPIERINNMYRFDLYYKFPNGEDKIIEIIKKVLINNEYNINLEGITLKITLDPQSYF